MPFKKILIAAPTSSNKNYCLEEYLINVSKIEYGNFKCVLFDNTLDAGENTAHINNTMKRLFGNDERFLAIHSNVTDCEGIISRICKGHNDCRTYAIAGGYVKMLHLETDVMIEPHFLQELILHAKPVVGACYYRDEGRFRKLMVQQRMHRSPNNVYMYNLDQQDDTYFIDGTLKRVGHIGLGCILIDIDVLKKVPFRYVPNIPLHTDSYWAEDVHKAGIKIYCDTNLICQHKNANWTLDVYDKNNKA